MIKAKATDIYFDADKPFEKKLGDSLFAAFVEHRGKLGIDFVIWDQEKSTQEGNVRAYPKPRKPVRRPRFGRESPVYIGTTCM